MRLSKKIKRATVYNATRGLMLVFNFIPRRLGLFIGSVLGIAAWKVLARDRHRVHRHLQIAYGSELDFREREAIGRRMFINFGKNAADLLRLKRFYQDEFAPIFEVEGLENLDKAYRRGKGVFVVTGHLGNFELLGVFIAAQGYEIAAIARELWDPQMDRLLVENRQALGVGNFQTTEFPRRMMSWLKAGKAVGVLIDTDSSRVRSEFIPSFGRMAHTSVGQSIMGLKVGAAFVPMACVRTEDNRYKIIARPEVEVPSTGDFDRDVLNVTEKCLRELEAIVEDHRDQWIWMHNRWRTKISKAS